ncbi:13903_t:CDS:1 [Acaulospora morrowiae]|uniref:13903_t:CDS:1 n=1 Tax=Acaulospora morrowiae TaxID=94023 RepID=A0A9N9CM23_9GLOM|nr:13903_t:CDS:1 [Acaulospora morrowiae]
MNILNDLESSQKTEIKQINIIAGYGSSRFSGVQFTVNIPNGRMNGDLSFAQFPNLMKITFSSGINVDDLGSIDVNKNEELCWLIFQGHCNFMNTYCKLLVNERQLDQVIVSYYDNGFKKERIRNQCLIPYRIPEDRKLEQLEAEVKKLQQHLAEKNQQINDLQTTTKKF